MLERKFKNPKGLDQKEEVHMTKTLMLDHTAQMTDTSSAFEVNEELRKHAWYPSINILQAQDLLSGKPAYTYLIRPSDIGRGFSISFVQKNGTVKHDNFTLINPKLGIWLNGHPSHVGKLAKVIRDMMHCSIDQGQPLSH